VKFYLPSLGSFPVETMSRGNRSLRDNVPENGCGYAAVIEDGFVHIPETAPWLAEYLHEMTVFPNASMTTKPIRLRVSGLV
jgi:phage terminase large subunit-like protein